LSVAERKERREEYERRKAAAEAQGPKPQWQEGLRQHEPSTFTPASLTSESPSDALAFKRKFEECTVRLKQKRYLDAAKGFQELYNICHEDGVPNGLSPFIESNVLNSLGDAYQATGEYSMALELMQKALDLSKELQLEKAGKDYAAVGQYEEAVPQFEQAMWLADEAREYGRKSWHMVNLGRAFRDMNMLPTAIQLLADASSITAQINSPQAEAKQLEELGRLYLQQLGIVFDFHSDFRRAQVGVTSSSDGVQGLDERQKELLEQEASMHVEEEKISVEAAANCFERSLEVVKKARFARLNSRKRVTGEPWELQMQMRQLCCLSVARHQQRNFDSAISNAQGALKLAKQFDDSQVQDFTLRRLALAYQEMGNK
jgi:tetratricopeptide (TPR) repeat protein